MTSVDGGEKGTGEGDPEPPELAPPQPPPPAEAAEAPRSKVLPRPPRRRAEAPTGEPRGECGADRVECGEYWPPPLPPPLWWGGSEWEEWGCERVEKGEWGLDWEDPVAGGERGEVRKSTGRVLSTEAGEL